MIARRNLKEVGRRGLEVCSTRPAFAWRLLVIGLFVSPSLQAHICGEQEIVLRVGQVKTYQIRADVAEDQPTIYNLIGIAADPIPDPNGGEPQEGPVPVAVDSAYGRMPFESYTAGIFYIVGLEVGSATVSFSWKYPPLEAEGVCAVNVIVLPDATAPPETGGNYDSSASSGDPVNLFTGELMHSEDPDLFLRGPMPLYFERYYASGLRRDALVGSRLGPNWMHNFDLRLVRAGDRIEVAFYRGRRISFEREGSEWRLVDGAIPFQLVEDGEIFSLADPRDKHIYKFNSEGLLVLMADGKGNEHTLTYDGLLLTEVTDGLGRSLTFTYVGFQELSGVSDGTRTIEFDHDFGGDLVRVRSALGHETKYSYDPNGGSLLTSIQLPKGNKRFSQRYDSEGRVIRQTDAYGNNWNFAYSEEDGLWVTRETDPQGNSTVYRHDLSGRLVSRTDARDETFALSYDGEGRLSRVTDREGYASRFEYDELSGLQRSAADPDGATTASRYATRELGAHTFRDLVATELADGSTISFTRDENGNALSMTEEGGQTWAYTYNDRGQQLSTANPKGGLTRFTYNDDGTLASIEDAVGNVTTFAYDNLRRLNAMQHPDGKGVALAYDAEDQITSVIDATGETWAMSYDENHNLVRLTGPDGRAYQYAYDAMDRIVTITDPLGNLSTYSYNSLGQVAAFTGAGGERTEFGYDERGVFTSLTDAAGETLGLKYDAEGVLRSVTDALEQTRFLESNEMGWITRFTDATGATTDRNYDLRGRVASLRDPLGRRTTFSSDARGRLSGITLPGGLSARYVRDELGELTAVIDPRGHSWSYSRDVIGRLAGASDPVGNELSFAYDQRHRVSEIELPGGLGTVEVAYGRSGNITDVSYSDGTRLKFLYDTNGWFMGGQGIDLERDGAGRISEANGIPIGREAGGRISSMTLPGGEVRYTYDARGLLAGIEDWQGGMTEFVYDEVRRLVSISRPNGVETRYRYDAENRILEIEERRAEGGLGDAIASTVLIRDAAGNITRRIRSAPIAAQYRSEVSEWTYDGASRVEQFTYDALGRRTADEQRAYRWDLGSRLTSYSEDGAAVSFEYDAFGNRLSRRAGSSHREYVWNYALGLTSVSVERESGSDLRYYVHTPSGMLLYSIEAAGGERRFYHYDEMGHTLALTDDDGDVLAAYAYGPYGEITGETGDVENPFTFQGMYGVLRESDGFYAVRARYYDARSGSFISRDPVLFTEPKAINPYQYALANPMRYADPAGSQSVLAESLSQQLQKSQDRIERLERDLKEDIENGRSDELINRVRRALEGEDEWSERLKRELEEEEEREAQRRGDVRKRHLPRKPVKEAPRKPETLGMQAEDCHEEFAADEMPVPPPSPVTLSPTGQVTDAASNSGTGARPRPDRSDPSVPLEVGKVVVQALAEGLTSNPIPVDATKVPEELGRTCIKLGEHADRFRRATGEDSDDYYPGRKHLKGEFREMREGGGGVWGTIFRFLMQ